MKTRAIDDPRVWWFGPSWESPVNALCPEAPTPIDDECLYCHTPIVIGHRGLLFRTETAIRVAAHVDCLVRGVLPLPTSSAWSSRWATTYRSEYPEDTFQIGEVAGHRSIRCLLCGRISENPGDVENKYCGRCHMFHHMIMDVRRARVTDGATHECDEWKTFRGLCAICDPNFVTGEL